MSRGCLRFPDCIPCAPLNTSHVVEKAAVEKVAVALYSEGRISETEMTEVVAGDRKYRQEADVLPSATSSPQVGQKKKRGDTRSSILPSIIVDQREAKLSSPPSSRVEKDPISLEPLDTDSEHVYEFRLSETSHVSYNIPTLVSYMVTTGDFTEPTSRIPLTDAQLSELDKMASKMDCGLPSVAEAKKTHGDKYAANKEQRDLVEGIERCLGEVVSGMIDSVTNARNSDPVGLVSQFHDFDHYLIQLVSIDTSMALSCLKQYKELAIGPKNKRRQDRTGLLVVLVSFLEGKIEELSAQS